MTLLRILFNVFFLVNVCGLTCMLILKYTPYTINYIWYIVISPQERVTSSHIKSRNAIKIANKKIQLAATAQREPRS